MTKPSKSTPSHEPIDRQQALVAEIRRLGEGGYIDVKVLPDGSIAALGDLLYTRAIYLSCDLWGYGRRYCFDNKTLANQRFEELQSEEDEPQGSIAQR